MYRHDDNGTSGIDSGISSVSAWAKDNPCLPTLLIFKLLNGVLKGSFAITKGNLRFLGGSVKSRFQEGMIGGSDLQSATNDFIKSINDLIHLFGRDHSDSLSDSFNRKGPNLTDLNP